MSAILHRLPHFFGFLFIFLITNPSLFAQKSADLDIPPFVQMPERFPKYPLKTKRMIYSDADLQIAKQNLAAYPEAAKVRDTIVAKASKWLEFTDTDLRNLLTDARVPRAFDVNPKGSPVHGDAVFKVGGTYPWIVDPRHPLQLKSPIDGQVFPSNDYYAYYLSGYKDKKGWGTPYTDDGFGYIAPDGERYWFVAYANQWTWKGHIEPALADLGRAYLLTGDKRFAHKAAVMLYRMAEVYPSMDHAIQSRYGLMERAKGRVYNGKVLNLIWEASLIQNAAEAYDAVWETIDTDSELHKFYGKGGQQIRSFIEANLLEDALDAYLQRKIQGNYGMHQIALIYILLARQNMDTEKYLHMIVEEPGESRVQSGMRYALYNMIFRDGQPLESPHYNLLTVEKLANFAEILDKGGIDLFKEPRLRALFDSPLNMMAIGKFTPDIGDSGTVLGEIFGRDPAIYQIGYKKYRNPAYLTWLASIGKTGGQTFSDFGSLFRAPLPAAKPLPDHRAVPVRPSQLMAGYGLGMLNNPADATSVAFNYGFKGTHYHWDFLNFELFANGQKMMPAMGYPDAMNEYVKELYTWAQNTVSHNTVVVDAGRQPDNVPGKLHDFSSGPFARIMDASSATYPQTSSYRRSMIMLDTGPGQSYVVDFFRVTGGKQHDYILHGPPGKVAGIGGSWGNIQPGTLAGANVGFGDIYDNAKFGAKDYAGSYHGYKGSGFQYFFNVQQFNQGKTILDYQHLLDTNARLRIHLMPQEKQEVFMADAYDKPRAKSHVLKFVIARRKAEPGKTLSSIFTAVLEPYATQSGILDKQFLTLEKGEGIALEIKRAGMTDVVISDTANTAKLIAFRKISTDANAAVVSFDEKGKLVRAFFSDGSYLTVNGRTFRAKQFEGVVSGVDPVGRRVNIRFDKNSGAEMPKSGSIVHFSNALRTTVHPVDSVFVQNNILTFKTGDDILVGKVHVTGASADSITTDTNLPFAPTYPGATILNDTYKPLGILKSATVEQLLPTGKFSNVPASGQNVWVSDIGVGDHVVIKSAFSFQAKD